jgi:hypothetical protein
MFALFTTRSLLYESRRLLRPSSRQNLRLSFGVVVRILTKGKMSTVSYAEYLYEISRAIWPSKTPTRPEASNALKKHLRFHMETRIPVLLS